MIRNAAISECGKYRWWLTRLWDGTLPAVTFIMLIPACPSLFYVATSASDTLGADKAFVPDDRDTNTPRTPHFRFAPSRDWRGAGMLIERFRLELWWDVDREAWGVMHDNTAAFGQAETPLLAVCRCVLLLATKRVKAGTL